MKCIFTLLFVLCFFNAQANDYYKAKIALVSGETLEGFAQLPSNKLLDNSIRFKSAKNQKSKKIKNKEIDKALYITESGNKYLLVRTKTRRILRSFGKVRENIIDKKVWLLLKYHHPKIDFYCHAQSYIINKEGIMIAKTVDRTGTWADIFLLLKRPNEVAPTIITSLSYGAKIIGKEKKFRKYSSIYFSDNESFVKRIKNKEFEHDKMSELIDAYILLKES